MALISSSVPSAPRPRMSSTTPCHVSLLPFTACNGPRSWQAVQTRCTTSLPGPLGTSSCALARKTRKRGHTARARNFISAIISRRRRLEAVLTLLKLNPVLQRIELGHVQPGHLGQIRIGFEIAIIGAVFDDGGC